MPNFLSLSNYSSSSSRCETFKSPTTFALFCQLQSTPVSNEWTFIIYYCILTEKIIIYNCTCSQRKYLVLFNFCSPNTFPNFYLNVQPIHLISNFISWIVEFCILSDILALNIAVGQRYYPLTWVFFFSWIYKMCTKCKKKIIIIIIIVCRIRLRLRGQIQPLGVYSVRKRCRFKLTTSEVRIVL